MVNNIRNNSGEITLSVIPPTLQRSSVTSIHFATVPSATTLEVSMDLMPGTHWNFIRRLDGLYLHGPTGEAQKKSTLLSPYLDPELFLRKPVRLRVTESSCTFTFPNISSLFYSANGEPPYISLGHATNFLGPKQHRFRFGSSLEFSLDIP